MTASHGVSPPPSGIDCAYFLDVDGTLLDIADTPDAICVDDALLDLLAQLLQCSGGAVALVSGRALADLERRFGSLGLALAGQHGLERRDAGGRRHIHAAPAPPRRLIGERLAPMLARHDGLLLEDKGMAMALHYRRAPHLADWAVRLMHTFAGPDLEVQRGKCVAEIKPAGCDKGTAMVQYLAEAPFRGRRPVFVGDDLNDERGFDEVNRRDGISIKVGSGPTCARYRLPDAAAVRRWLHGIVEETAWH